MLWSCMFTLQAITSFDDHADDIFLPNQVEGAKPPVPTSFFFQKRKRPYHSLKHCGRWAWPLWNMYIPQQNIIYKERTQEKRGYGIRRKAYKIPGKWLDFLCDPENKQECFAFLSEKNAASEFSPEMKVI